MSKISEENSFMRKDPYLDFINNWPVYINKTDANTTLYLQSMPNCVYIECLRWTQQRIINLEKELRLTQAKLRELKNEH